MALWLDLLRTPMAAPETRALKAMRLTVLVLCAILALSIAAVASLRAAIGNLAGGLIGVVLLALVLLVPIYVRAKNRADNAHLDALCGEGER